MNGQLTLLIVNACIAERADYLSAKIRSLHHGTNINNFRCWQINVLLF